MRVSRLVFSRLFIGMLVTIPLVGCSGESDQETQTADPCAPGYEGEQICPDHQGDAEVPDAPDIHPPDVPAEDGDSGSIQPPHSLPCIEDETGDVISGWCLIDDECHEDGDRSPDSSCGACSSGTDYTTWSAAPDGSDCLMSPAPAGRHNDADPEGELWGRCVEGDCSREDCSCGLVDECCDGCMPRNNGEQCWDESLTDEWADAEVPPCVDGLCGDSGRCEMSIAEGWCLLDDGTCRNTAEDVENCGTCGNSCAPGQLCVLGACVDQCQGGLVACGDECADLLVDEQHCGSCFNSCPAGALCVQGQCQIPASGISVSPTHLQLARGESAQLVAEVRPADATNTAVLWESSNPEAVGVDQTGQVTALGGHGQATVTATAEDGGFSASATVQLRIAVAQVQVNPANLTLQMGEAVQLQTTVLPADATNTGLLWSSDNPGIASVSIDGTITAEAIGPARITAASVDGGAQGYCEVVVVATSVSGITLQPDQIAIEEGQSHFLEATVVPADATDRRILWSSNSPSSVSVSPRGEITGLQPGQAVITATTVDGGHFDTCTVSVVISATGISLSPQQLSLHTGGTGQIAANVTPPEATNRTVTWWSADSAVAQVDQAGLVLGVGAGLTTISAATEDHNHTASASVFVGLPVTSVELTPSELNLAPGQSAQVDANVVPPDATFADLTWESDDTEVVTVDQDGLVKARSVGAASVTATTEDGLGSDTVTVRVAIPVSDLSVEPEFFVLRPQESVVIEATITPEDATDRTIFWSSSDSEVVTVAGDGTVTGVGRGEATISATSADGGHDASTEIHIYPLGRGTWDEPFVGGEPLPDCSGYLETDYGTEDGFYLISPEGPDGTLHSVFCSLGDGNLSWRGVVSIEVEYGPGDTAVNDYPVLLSVNTQALITSGEMRSDCGDMRFLDVSAGGEDGWLGHWIEDSGQCNSEDTPVWVSIPFMEPASTKTIHMYHGDTSANFARGDGEATFSYFDDFTSNTSSQYTLWSAPSWPMQFTWDTANSRLATDRSNNEAFLTWDGSDDLAEGFIVETRARSEDDDAVTATIRTAEGHYYSASATNDYDGLGHNNAREALIRHTAPPTSHNQAARLIAFNNVVNPQAGWVVVGLSYDGSHLSAHFNYTRQSATYNAGTLGIHSLGLGSLANNPPAYYDWWRVRRYLEGGPQYSRADPSVAIRR